MKILDARAKPFKILQSPHQIQKYRKQFLIKTKYFYLIIKYLLYLLCTK